MIKVMAMIAAAGLAAAPAAAQHEHERENQRTIAEVLLASETGRDIETVNVTIRDGEASVRVNGVKLAPEHVRTRDDGAVEFRWGGQWRSTRGAPEAPEAPGQRRVMLGVVLGDIDEALATQLGIDPDRAVLIQRVIEGSAADRAGIKRFDILTGFAGESHLSVDRLIELLTRQSPGSSAPVVVLRGGETKRLMVSFEAAPEGESETQTPSPHGRLAPTPPESPRVRFFGRELDERTRAQLHEAMREAERHAKEAQETAKRLTIELQERLQPLREIELDMTLDGEARAEFEKAMAQLQEALRSADFDVDFDVDLRLEELPRMMFIETDRDGEATARRGLRLPDRESRERAVILENRESDGQRRPDRFPRGLREGAAPEREGQRLDRLEERLERLESLLERALERMERREHNQRRDGSGGA